MVHISKTISLYLLIATAINIVRTDDDDDDNDDKVILHWKWKRLVMPLQMTNPLSKWKCKQSPYKELRSCKMLAFKKKKALQKFLSKKYFCVAKDEWKEFLLYKSTIKRQKRAVNGCGGREKRRVILMAYEAARPNRLRELLHDPENHLYQTIFVKECQSKSPVKGMKCQMHRIKFKAAVFSLNPKSNRIEVMEVLTPGYCALTAQ